MPDTNPVAAGAASVKHGEEIFLERCTGCHGRKADGKGPNVANPKGWQLVYETPAPLVEFPVRFELKDIPLP